MESASSPNPTATLSNAASSMNNPTSERAREVFPDLFLFLLKQIPPLATKSLRLISPIVWLIHRPISVLVWWAIRLLYGPLHPFVVLAHSLFGIFVQAPYNAVAQVLSALYPLLALCGIAFVCSGILGLGGRFLCSIIISSITPPPKQIQPHKDSRHSYHNSTQMNLPMKWKDEFDP